MNYIQINSIKLLKELAGNHPLECFIELTGGVRIRKNIYYEPDLEKFFIDNWIDESKQELTEKQLSTKSNIGEAIVKGSFFSDDEEANEHYYESKQTRVQAKMKQFLFDYSRIHDGASWIINMIHEKQCLNDTSKRFLIYLKKNY